MFKCCVCVGCASQVLVSFATVKDGHGIAVGDVRQVDIEDNGSAPRILSDLAMQSAELVLLAVFGLASLGFQLRGKNARKENTSILMLSSLVALVAMNCLIWYRIIFTITQNLRYFIEGDNNQVGYLFLALMAAVFIIAADATILVQMFLAVMSRYQKSSDLPIAQNSVGVEEDTPTSNTIVDENSDQEVNLNNFRSLADHCEICTRDFNSWCSQRFTSTYDTINDCFDSIFDSPKSVQMQVHRPVQVVSASTPVRESVPRGSERVNVCRASGGCGTLFMGPLDEESGSDSNRSAHTGCSPSTLSAKKGKEDNILNGSSQNKDRNHWKVYRLIGVASKKMWKKICEDNTFRFSMWMKVAGLVSAVVLVYNCISAICTLQDFAREVSQYSHVAHIQIQIGQPQDTLVSLGVDSDVIDTSEKMAPADNDATPMASSGGQIMEGLPGFVLQHSNLNTDRNLVLIQSRYLTKVARFFLSLMDDFIYTVVVGYTISTGIGFCSLYYIFVSQKEMVVKLNNEKEMSCQGEICLQRFWERSRPRYRVGAAVHFLGTLVSTAVIQQHVIGVFISVVLAMAANAGEIFSILDTNRYGAASLLGVLVSAVVISHFLGNYILSDGLRVCHPRWFFLFVFVFTVVNFVLGAFHGAYRLVFLLLSTFITISRLDVSSFQSTRGLDNGHNTFMSMVLLTHKIQAVVRAPDVVNAE